MTSSFAREAHRDALARTEAEWKLAKQMAGKEVRPETSLP